MRQTFPYFVYENEEGHTEYNISRDMFENREPGLSAMVRVKNEEEYIEPALRSILPWCDEVVVALQASTDRTEEIVRSIDDPKIVVLTYPFPSWPNGPGHNTHSRFSVNDRAYFYNWTMSKTTRSYVMKWDGDMVAYDWLGATVRGLMVEGSRVIAFKGIDIVGPTGPNLYVGERLYCATDKRVFVVDPAHYYYQGEKCEKLAITGYGTNILPAAGYLHFKWAKNIHSATQSWPKNWQGIPHYEELMKRARAHEPYDGDIPTVLKGRFR